MGSIPLDSKDGKGTYTYNMDTYSQNRNDSMGNSHCYLKVVSKFLEHLTYFLSMNLMQIQHTRQTGPQQRKIFQFEHQSYLLNVNISVIVMFIIHQQNNVFLKNVSKKSS